MVVRIRIWLEDEAEPADLISAFRGGLDSLCNRSLYSRRGVIRMESRIYEGGSTGLLVLLVFMGVGGI